MEHQTKEDLWKHLKFTVMTVKDEVNPTQMELVECTEFAKERNERFRVHKDKAKKAHSLVFRHCDKAM